MFNNVHVWGFWCPTEMSKLRRVLLKPVCTNSGHVGCRIVLLKFQMYVGMPNGHKWVLMIRQDVYIPVTCQSRI
ncbi:hypothetical protein TNCV_4466181 [Trichonephila clavipes]|nr:hypothetical protein TNCV_4466181 [Trichonephila clavipes]